MGLVRVYLLHSGGMDSHIAWLLNPWMTPVYVLHNAPAEAREIDALEALTREDHRFYPHIIAGLNMYSDPKDAHVRYRNMLLMTTVAHTFTDAGAIAYGALLGEGTGDKSWAFRRALEKTWRASERDAPRILAPLRRWTKAGALRQVLDHPKVDTLRLTVSCYDPDGPCGECQPCFRRGVAHYLVGWRTAMPPPPRRTHGVAHAIRNVPLSHLPSMALSNIDPIHGWIKERLT